MERRRHDKPPREEANPRSPRALAWGLAAGANRTDRAGRAHPESEPIGYSDRAPLLYPPAPAGAGGEKAGVRSARHLIGRDHALRSVRASIAGPGLTSVLGSPGLGKTVLVRAALPPDGYREGGALRSLVNRPYLPLEHALQIALHGDAEAVAERVIAQLDGSVLFVDDLHWAHLRCIDVLALVHIEKPVVVASRREGLGAEGAAL